MKYHDLNNAIEHLEKEIRTLYNDYEELIKRDHRIKDATAIRMHIKQAEESLRLKKKMLCEFLN
ncbi:MAG TPA: hypothetical protein VHB70_00520 [Parafilimonas sp.]|nr:hypothetical protein [Parafilimonas sp.]